MWESGNTCVSPVALADLPNDWLVTSGSYLLPEFLNRNEVRSFAMDVNDYKANRTVARTIDNNETTFTPDGTVTRKTLSNAPPAGDEGSSTEGGANETPGDNSSGDDDYLYHEFLNESKIKRSKFEQEAVWMDSIGAGHGYFSLDTASTTANAGPSSSNTETLRITRNLTVTESLGSYFGIGDAASGTGAAGGTTAGSSSGGTSGTSSPPPGTSPPTSGSDSGSSTYLPATGDGSLTGHFAMTTKDESKSDYQWKQTNFSRFANVTYSHVQKDVTKIGIQAVNSETKESTYSADFLENGRTSYNTTKTKTTFSEWNNNTFGSSVLDYRLAGSTETEFHSNFSGNHNSTTTDTEGVTGESIHDNVGKTMTSETSASATANGYSRQTTTENYVVVPLLTMNAIVKKVTTETITEVVGGTYYSNVDLLDMSGNGNQYTGGIKLNRTTGMSSVSTFTMQSPVTQNNPAGAEEKHWGASFQVSELKTFAYGSSEDPEEYSAIVKTLWTRVWGTLKLALGIVEVATGVLAVKTGVGAPFGVIAIIHGLDTMYAGATQLVSGDTTDTLTKRLANSAFLAHFKPANEQEKKELEKFGEGIDSLVGIVGGLGGGGAMFNGAKQLKQGGRVANAAGGQKAIDAASDVGSNLKKAALGSKADDVANAGSDVAETIGQTGCFLANTPCLISLPFRNPSSSQPGFLDNYAGANLVATSEALG